jgi:hypothetical protein
MFYIGASPEGPLVASGLDSRTARGARCDLMPVIREGNFVFVTNNGRDFPPLYAKKDIHPGLVILIPGSLEREEQVELFGRVLDVIEPLPDIVNRVIEVFSEGSVEVREWPDPTPTVLGRV